MEPITDNDRKEVRRIFNTDEEQIERDINILKEWIKKQPHLPQGVQDDVFLESMLLRCKCRVEKTKKYIDGYYTYKNILPDAYEAVKDLLPSNCNAVVLPLRRLTEKKERVILCGLQSRDPEKYDISDYLKMLLSISEILIRNDYNAGVRFITVVDHLSMAIVMKISLPVLKNMEKIFLHAYGNRITGVHFMSDAPWMKPMMALLKHVLPKKIYERVQVHNDDHPIWKDIPREILPTEFGGSDKTIKELLAEWDQVFEKNRKVLNNLLEHKSNEKLRIGPCEYDVDQFGVDGTFKKLNID